MKSSALSPLLAENQPVDWRFAFKFNRATCPGDEMYLLDGKGFAPATEIREPINGNGIQKKDFTLDSKSVRELFLLFAFAMLTVNATGTAQAAGSWSLSYKDNYDYASQPKGSTTFNTWMWREDCNGNHTFQDTQSDGCSAAQPCVKLTAEVYDSGHAACKASQLSPSSGKTGNNLPYINSEMYNNACVRQGPGHPEPQDFDMLLTYRNGGKNPWIQTTILGNPIIQPFVMYEELRLHCDMPYPYDPAWQNAHPVTPYAKDSWNTASSAMLYANSLAYGTSENAGMWFRDLAWNTPYLADKTISKKIEMSINAEGDGPGSRGWGFWNTTMNPLAWQYAWFMEFTNPGSAPSKNKSGSAPSKSLLAMTVTEINLSNLSGGGVCTTNLTDDVYHWHDYSIIWSAGAIEYRIDQKTVAIHTHFVPDNGMAFHNWVDNRNYSGTGPGNYPLLEPRSNIIRKFEVYNMEMEADTSSLKSQVPTSSGCTSWQTIIRKMTDKKKPAGKNAEKEMAKKLAAEMKSIKDLTALLIKLGVL